MNLLDLPPIDWRELKIDTKGRSRGQVKTLCPKCSHTRKNRHEPCLSVNLDMNRWLCHHCGWKGPEPGFATARGQVGPGAPAIGARLRSDEREAPRVYARPDELPPTPEERFRTALLDFWRSRGISEATVDAFKITADQKGMHFPYYRNDELINIKHRWYQVSTDQETGEIVKKKRHRMEAGAELIFYNLDECERASTVYIVEGEPDVLAMREAGYTAVISPPNGAPAENVDIGKANFDYLPSGQALFETATRVVMCGDMDVPGRRLMDELARRIGKEKCWRVEWPEGYKDANEVLADEFLGGDGVRHYVETARPYPVEGITQPIDYIDELWKYEHATEQGVRLSEWAGFSEIVRISEGQLSIWTGIPSSGKSVFLNHLTLHLALEHGWKIGVFSPEYHPTELHVRDLIECALGKPMNTAFNKHATRDEVTAILEKITEHYRFILPPEPSLDEVLYRAQALVYREGIKFLIIDPWTELDQSRPNGMSATDWVDICLKRIRRFGRKHEVHVAVVAHPTKMKPIEDREGTRQWPVVTPYDISDSRHWYEMADVICSVWRDKMQPTEPVEIHVQKVRFRDNGDVGKALFTYDRISRRYTDVTHRYSPEDRMATV